MTRPIFLNTVNAHPTIKKFCSDSVNQSTNHPTDESPNHQIIYPFPNRRINLIYPVKYRQISVAHLTGINESSIPCPNQRITKSPNQPINESSKHPIN